jgi:hypothetical protein
MRNLYLKNFLKGRFFSFKQIWPRLAFKCPKSSNKAKKIGLKKLTGITKNQEFNSDFKSDGKVAKKSRKTLETKNLHEY